VASFVMETKPLHTSPTDSAVSITVIRHEWLVYYGVLRTSRWPSHSSNRVADRPFSYRKRSVRRIVMDGPRR